MRSIFVLALLLGAAGTQARVFSYKDSGVAAYVRGTGFTSAVGQNQFGNSSGANTVIDGKTKYGYSGEIGALIGLTPSLMMRLGAEMIQHHPVSDESGFRPNGTTKRFEMDSTVYAFNPNITFEYYYTTMGNWRFYGAIGAGMAQVTAENTYRMTAIGTSDLGVAADFTEKLEGSGLSYTVATGFETLFTDNATLTMDVGYRHLPIPELKFKGDVNNIVDNPAAKGDVATNHDGAQRTLDMGGIFVGISFRFYLNFM